MSQGYERQQEEKTAGVLCVLCGECNQYIPKGEMMQHVLWQHSAQDQSNIPSSRQQSSIATRLGMLDSEHVRKRSSKRNNSPAKRLAHQFLDEPPKKKKYSRLVGMVCVKIFEQGIKC